MRLIDAGPRVRQLVADAMAAGRLSGLAVAIVDSSGSTVVESLGTARQDPPAPVLATTRFRIGSLSKIFTTLTVMRVYEKGLIDLDAPVNTYLRGFRVRAGRRRRPEVTVRHLLTHTSGLDGWRRTRDVLLPNQGETVEPGRRPPSLVEYYRPILRGTRPPGSRHEYSNHAFSVLGQLVEDVTGTPFARCVDELVVRPLGLRHTTLYPVAGDESDLAHGYDLDDNDEDFDAFDHRDTVLVPAMGAVSSISDLAIVLSSLLNCGPTLLDPGTVTQMFESQYRAHPLLHGQAIYFWQVEAAGRRLLWHNGFQSGHASFMYLVPDEGIAIAVLTNTPTWHVDTDLAPALLDLLLPAKTGPARAAPAPAPGADALPVPAAEGLYVLAHETFLTRRLSPSVVVHRRGDALTLRVMLANGEYTPATPLVPDAAEPLRFVASPSIGIGKVAFSQDPQGRVVSLCTNGYTVHTRRPLWHAPPYRVLTAVSWAVLNRLTRVWRRLGRQPEWLRPDPVQITGGASG